MLGCTMHNFTSDLIHDDNLEALGIRTLLDSPGTENYLMALGLTTLLDSPGNENYLMAPGMRTFVSGSGNESFSFWFW